MMKLSYKLKPLFLVKIFSILFVLNMIAIFLQYYLQVHNTNSTLTLPTKYFLFDGENNFPTYFSTIDFLLSSFLLFSISKNVKNSNEPLLYKKWYLLGCLFIWLAMDELFSFHEMLIEPTQKFLKIWLQQDTLGFLYFSWFVPYALVFILVGLYLLRFAFMLPPKTLVKFIMASLIFISGGFGLEMVGGYIAEKKGNQFSLTYQLCATAEETLEMLGVIYFIYALINYIECRENLKRITIKFDIGFKDGKRTPIRNKLLDYKE